MRTRRTCLAGAVLLAGAVGVRRAVGEKADEVSIQVKWRVPRERVSEILNRVPFKGRIEPDAETAEDTRGLPLIYVLVGLVASRYLAETLIYLYEDVRYGGVVIDASGDELVIRSNPGLAGKIIVRDAEGVEVFESRDRVDVKDLLSTLLRVTGKK